MASRHLRWVRSRPVRDCCPSLDVDEVLVMEVCPMSWPLPVSASPVFPLLIFCRSIGVLDNLL